MQQSLKQIDPSFVAHTEAAIAEEPRERPLHHPAVSSESLGGVDPATRDPGCDAPRPERAAQGRGVVGLIGVQRSRTLTGPTWFSSWSDDRRDRVNIGQELGRVVSVGRREAHGQGDAIAVDDQMVFGAELATVDRVRPGLLAPLLARTLSESTLARFQSRAAASPNQLSRVSCNRAHTPASCQSRSRRQQVVPLPQPSSLGSRRQGHPVRRTKMMPPRAARSGMRGRPSCSRQRRIRG